MIDGTAARDESGAVTVSRGQTVGASRIVVRLTGRARPVLDVTLADVLDTPALVELLTAYVTAHADALRAASEAPDAPRRPLPVPAAVRPDLHLLP